MKETRILFYGLLLGSLIPTGLLFSQQFGGGAGGGEGAIPGGGAAGGAGNRVGGGPLGTGVDAAQDIQAISVLGQGQRFDRESRQPGTFVGFDSVEASDLGFVGQINAAQIPGVAAVTTGGRIGGAAGGLGGIGGGGIGGGGLGGGRGGLGGGLGGGLTGGLGGAGGSLGGLGGGLGGLGGLGGGGLTGGLGGGLGRGLGGGLGGLGGGLTGGLGGFGGLGGGLGAGGLAATNQVLPQTRLRVRFRPVAAPPVPVVQARLEQQINRARRIRRINDEPIRIALDGDTATLSGTVETMFDRDRAVGFVRLEPRIIRIVDELVVANPDTAVDR